MGNDRSSGQLVEPGEFFVVRVPALPFSTLTDWSAGVEAPAAAAAELDGALARDRALLGSRLRALSGRADVRSALLVASPDLVHATPSVRAQLALVRYVSRMASRPTPFGLFAASGVGKIGMTTTLSIPPPERWRRTTMLDGGYLEALLAECCDSPELRDRFTLRPNATITRAAGRIRLIRWRAVDQGRRHYVVEVHPTPEMERALDAARPGARLPDIAAAVAAPAQVQTRELDYVRALVRAQILVADVQLQLTGATSLNALITDLQDVGGGTTADLLCAIRDILRQLDDDSGVSDTLHYNKIRDLLALASVTPAAGHPCHVVLSLPPGGSSLARATAGDVERGVRLLARIASPAPDDELAEFSSAFAQRYGRREVPLAEALDDQVGVGFGTTEPDRANLLDGLLSNERPTPAVPFTPRDQALLELVLRATESGSREVNLTPEDIEALEAKSPRPVAASFAAIVSLANTAGGPRILFSSSWGPSGMQLLGRFCHSDPELTDLVRRHLLAEAALEPEAVYAEIVHLAAGVGANIIARPLLREWEIEWLGRSGAPPERRLSTSDLLVSVSDDKVVLRSRRLGRRVVPRLSSAHHWSRHSPPIYRFLCALQFQDQPAALIWDWGHLAAAPFLPRVRWGRLVFARARWVVTAAELERADDEPWCSVQAIRTRRGLPRWVAVAEDDNELVVDLDNVLSVDSFVQLLRRRRTIRVHEMFPAPDELVAHGSDGPYAHQLIVPFIAEPSAETRAKPPHPKAATPTRIADAKPPEPSCGEWVVLELGSGTATADRISWSWLRR